MPLIKKSTKEKVNNHDHSEAIELGTRAFAKGLLSATKKAEKIEKHNHSKKDVKSKSKATESKDTQHSETVSKSVSTKEPLVSDKIESKIKKSGHSEEISKLLDIVTPKVLDTLSKVAHDSTKNKSALTKSVQTPKEASKPSKVVDDNSKSTPVKTAETTDAKGLISPEVKAELKTHPEKDTLVKTIQNFINLFVSHHHTDTAKHGTSTKVAQGPVETVTSEDKSKAATKITAVIDDSAKDLPTSAAPVASAPTTSASVISPALKQQIDAHPYRDAIMKFFKHFLPEILEVFKVAGAALTPIFENMAQDAIKKALPGQTGDVLAKVTGDAINSTEKSVVDSINASSKPASSTIKATDASAVKTAAKVDATAQVIDSSAAKTAAKVDATTQVTSNPAPVTSTPSSVTTDHNQAVQQQQSLPTDPTSHLELPQVDIAGGVQQPHTDAVG